MGNLYICNAIAEESSAAHAVYIILSNNLKILYRTQQHQHLTRFIFCNSISCEIRERIYTAAQHYNMENRPRRSNRISINIQIHTYISRFIRHFFKKEQEFYVVFCMLLLYWIANYVCVYSYIWYAAFIVRFIRHRRPNHKRRREHQRSYIVYIGYVKDKFF